MNQKTSKVEKEFYLRCSYLTLSVLFDKEPFFQINSVPEVVSSKNKPKFLEAARFCHNLFY
ncbi:hypothetical protein AS241_12200 [Enterococcus faecium]|nr:hypothetical protein AS241_12200 [Enterococcus faecium]KWY94455.1 hypothetical protein AS256_11825 [Enterococcus faecium]